MKLYDLQDISDAVTQRIHDVQHPEKARSKREQEIDELRDYILGDLNEICRLLMDKHPENQPIQP